VYHLLTHREAFDPKRVEIDDAVRREREHKRLVLNVGSSASPVMPRDRQI